MMIHRRRGFSLAETMVSILIVSVLIGAALNTVGAATVSRKSLGDRGKGELLAHDLMTEILQQNYEEPDETPTFGQESSESGGSREFFDDVDDYEGWDARPPENKDGTLIPDLDGWRRRVKVDWVDPDDLTTVEFSDTGVKRIVVVVKFKDKPLASVLAIRTRAAGAVDSKEWLDKGLVVPEIQ